MRIQTKDGNYVVISEGNKKLGTIPSFNTSRDYSCDKRLSCYKKGCYAKACWGKFRPAAYASVVHNAEMCKSSRQAVSDAIKSFLLNGAVSYNYFRWHASGDIVDRPYFEMMIQIAKACPNTKFLAYTKRYAIVNGWIAKNGIKALPKNLIIRFSAWKKTDVFPNPFKLPVFYVDFSTMGTGHPELNPDIPSDSMKCPGVTAGCYRCFKCWTHNPVVCKFHGGHGQVKEKKGGE